MLVIPTGGAIPCGAAMKLKGPLLLLDESEETAAGVVVVDAIGRVCSGVPAEDDPLPVASCGAAMVGLTMGLIKVVFTIVQSSFLNC